jgi:SAM-dependent methyltransferase
MRVLDVGCGTGAITAGIARAVGPRGFVLGIDRDAALLGLARTRYGGFGNLEFREQDVLTLDAESDFDIVTAARALQWIERPDLAVARMKAAAKPGGLVIALDYNHDQNHWEPEPPPVFRTFYESFLQWRDANHWDNAMGEHLPDLFAAAGLVQISAYREDEVARRGEPGFTDAASIWSSVIETLGPKITKDGYLSEADRLAAALAWKPCVLRDLSCQTLVLRAVAGQTP